MECGVVQSLNEALRPPLLSCDSDDPPEIDLPSKIAYRLSCVWPLFDTRFGDPVVAMLGPSLPPIEPLVLGLVPCASFRSSIFLHLGFSLPNSCASGDSPATVDSSSSTSSLSLTANTDHSSSSTSISSVNL
ncbi:hypothetical protein QN277_002182 [Acacia crassicarpa]|uniref:Uncharacterized protein n=1 Tax=Acacia crassicarpa TaxID=499986 RepID=A0AAE1NA36_9FABA|nr:hypothetical protein QN277_002182 [Acacia crassicarpa]